MEYRAILSEIKKRKLKHKDIQEYLGVTKAMLSRKLHGRSGIRLDEAVKIRDNFFPDMTIDELFLGKKKEDETLVRSTLSKI